MTAQWFDTHAHYSDPKFDADRDAIIERAYEKGITGIVEIADGPDEWEKADRLTQKHKPRMWWAGGFHPYYADQASTDNLAKLKSYTTHPNLVAIGEVGLDYAKCTLPKEVQQTSFKHCIELALETNKPLVIHCREAYPDLLPILRQYFKEGATADAVSPGVLHCFSGNLKEAEELIRMGFYLGVDGPLTYPKSDNLRDIFQKVSLNKIVLETDAPYLPPQSQRGKRNDSSFLPIIGETLAKIRSAGLDSLSQQLIINSCQLYRIEL